MEQNGNKLQPILLFEVKWMYNGCKLCLRAAFPLLLKQRSNLLDLSFRGFLLTLRGHKKDRDMVAGTGIDMHQAELQVVNAVILRGGKKVPCFKMSLIKNANILICISILSI